MRLNLFIKLQHEEYEGVKDKTGMKDQENFYPVLIISFLRPQEKSSYDLGQHPRLHLGAKLTPNILKGSLIRIGLREKDALTFAT